MSEMTPEVPTNEEGWAILERWGRQPRMNELEALMWRSEDHPTYASSGITVETLETAPDWERFRGAHEWGTSLVPRLRERVVEPLLPLGTPAWSPDPEFDLDYHVRRARLREPAGMDELLELACEIGQTPLDRSRPPWTGTLVDNLEGGRAAYILHSHHSMLDGEGLIQLFNGLHSTMAEPSPDKPTAFPGAAQPASPLTLTIGDVADGLRHAPRSAVRLLGSARNAVTAPGNTLSFLASLRRVTSPPPDAAPSPLLERQTGRVWRYGALECDLTALKAAGRAAGGSVNDAYVAALLGGIRRYHEAVGIELGDIPIGMPVSIRRPDDPPGSNRFAGAMFGAPAGSSDPAERIAALRGAVLSIREEPALDVLGSASTVLCRLPSPLLSRVVHSAVPKADLSASNIPGLLAPVYAAGSKVERMFVFAPLPGCAMMSTMVSYVGTCCIGINCDGAVFEDTGLLWRCMQEGLDEVLELGHDAKTGA
jgi:diacylglycerol O-acyltransferase / wax synthase